MCFRQDMKRTIKDLEFGNYLEVLRMAQEINVKSIRLQMYGDPLCYPRLIEAIIAAQDKFESIDLIQML